MRQSGLRLQYFPPRQSLSGLPYWDRHVRDTNILRVDRQSGSWLRRNNGEGLNLDRECKLSKAFDQEMQVIIVNTP
jgi:hypothetical protein